MLKFSFTLLFVFCTTIFVFSQNHLVSYKKVSTITKDEFRKKLKENRVKESIIPVRYNVDVYAVEYMSRWHDGTPIKASGYLFVPDSLDKTAEMMVYHHGTQLKRSKEFRFGGEAAICAGFCTDGFVVVRPDYIGLGTGEKFHLYQNKKSEAWSSVDFMFAAHELQEKIGFKLNDDIFITGYSQGGHASMALHQELQENYKGVFNVTASSPMSGAYDMSGVQANIMFEPYETPSYLPYLLRGLNEVYNIYPGDIMNIFKDDYQPILDTMFMGEVSLRYVHNKLPSIPADMIRKNWVDTFVHNPDFPLHAAIKDNDTYHGWAPEAPMQLCYCKGDEQVTYKNAFVAHDAFKEAGAKHVTLRSGGKSFDHNTCAVFTAMYTKFYFNSFRKGKQYGKKGPTFKRFMISMAKMVVKRKEKKKEKKKS